MSNIRIRDAYNEDGGAHPFTPSRKRLPIADTINAANQERPTGRALPSLISGLYATQAEHTSATLRGNPSAELLESAVGARISEVARLRVKFPDKIVENRAMSVTAIQDIATRLFP